MEHVVIRVNKSDSGVFEELFHLLLEMLVVTAVTEAREIVSGSRDPASRIAFLSRSSMSRTAGSSEQPIIIIHCLLADFERGGCLETFTSFSVIVFVDLDLSQLHGREHSLPCSDGWRKWGKEVRTASH